jgi:hypothetical protein
MFLRGIPSFYRSRAFELVRDPLEGTFDMALIGFIILARYQQELARANWSIDKV